MSYVIDEVNSDITFEVDGTKVRFIVTNISNASSSDSSSSGSTVYLIKAGDTTTATDKNTFSALRILAELAALKEETLEEAADLFLSKTDDDTAAGLITFLQGLLTEGDIASTDFDEATQTGFSIHKNDSGKWHAFFTNLTVWGKAIFNELEIRKLSAVGGSVVLSAASSKIVYVEDYYVDGVMVGWKCYYLADDGTTATQNGWVVGDQARCQSFNIEEGTYTDVGNKDYWRCVIAVSSENETISDDDGNVLYDGQEFGWVVLSLTNAQASDYGSMIEGAEFTSEGYEYLSTPAADDAIVLEGHQIQDDDNSDELNRMNMILLTAADEEPQIMMYQGIYTFSLDGRCVAKMAPSGWEILSSSFTWSTGSVTVPNYVDMGEWTEGSTATQYTIWYYEGNTWRYDGSESTTEAPSADVSGWVQLTYNSTYELTREICIELSLGGQMYYDETETVTLSVWDVAKSTEYTDAYTFSVERDSGDDSSDAVWNAAFAANYDGGNTFTIAFSDLNFVDGSRTTKFWVYATETETGEELEEEVIEY